MFGQWIIAVLSVVIAFVLIMVKKNSLNRVTGLLQTASVADMSWTGLVMIFECLRIGFFFGYLAEVPPFLLTFVNERSIKMYDWAILILGFVVSCFLAI